MSNTPIAVIAFNELVKHIQERKPRIITVDGRDGSGKTYLANQLHKALGGTRLDEVTYREATLSGHFQPRTIELLRDLSVGLDKLPIIYESCLMRYIMQRIGLTPELSIYVKKVSPMGLWCDEDELDYRATEKEAVAEALKMGATPFRTQMIEYHYRFRPHEQADIVYHRPDVIM